MVPVSKGEGADMDALDLLDKHRMPKGAGIVRCLDCQPRSVRILKSRLEQLCSGGNMT